MSVVAVDRLIMKVPGWAVAAQLARREGARMLRHPIPWVGVVLSVAFFGLLTWEAAPVLHRDDVNVAGGLLPLAAATLILANLAASRATRNGTDELFDTAPATRGLRTVGQLLGLAYPVLASMALGALMFVYLFLDSPVGSPRIAEVATGPLAVALLGALGIAIGRWKPHPALGPMAVVLIAGIEILFIQGVVGIQGDATVVGRVPWFGPWVPISILGNVPSELVVRPSGWHALYLTGLLVFFAASALLRDGRRSIALVIIGIGATGTIVGTVGQMTPATASQRAAMEDLLANPEDHQVCEERNGVTYCAYPAYVGWIDRWARPVEGALAAIPPEDRPTGLVVRQRFGGYFEGTVDVSERAAARADRAVRREVRVGTGPTTFWTDARWGRHDAEGEHEIGLALWIASDAVGLPSTREELKLTPAEKALARAVFMPRLEERFHKRFERALRRRPYGCTTAGQARALAALWIVAQATPDTRATVERVTAENPFGISIYEANGQRYAYYLGGYSPLYPLARPPMQDWVMFSDSELHYTARLLDQPRTRVQDLMEQHWEAMTETTARTTSFFDDFGLTPLPTVDEQIAALPSDVTVERGTRRAAVAGFVADQIPCI